MGFLELIRSIDDRVASCEQRFLPSVIAKRFDPDALATESFIEVVRSIQPGPSVTADWELDVVPVFREAASALGITPGVLVVETVSAEYLKNGTPILVSKTLYRIDRVNFKAGGSWTINKRANARASDAR